MMPKTGVVVCERCFKSKTGRAPLPAGSGVTLMGYRNGQYVDLQGLPEGPIGPSTKGLTITGVKTGGVTVKGVTLGGLTIKSATVKGVTIKGAT